MNRRKLLTFATAGTLTTMLPRAEVSSAASTRCEAQFPHHGKPVKPPQKGPLRVAFVVGPETVLIDVAGPWEAFTDSMHNIELYLVAPPRKPVDLGGIRARPDYTFENAPQPHVIVVPATQELPESIHWVQRASKRADITMSICVGAFFLAKAGLLNGLYATTHHSGYDTFAKMYPDVKLVKGPRYVENWNVSTSGGETSGIALALRVVERYYGKPAAQESAANMEYVQTPRPEACATHA